MQGDSRIKECRELGGKNFQLNINFFLFFLNQNKQYSSICGDLYILQVTQAPSEVILSA